MSKAKKEAPVKEAQNITADLGKFDVAKANVDNAVKSLAPYETITTVDQQTEALVKMKEANAVGKAIEEKRKELVKPFNEAVKKINAYAKDLTGKIDTKITEIKGVALAFQQAEEKRLQIERSKKRVETLTALEFVRNDEAKILSREDIGLVTFLEINTMDDDQFIARINLFTEKIQEKANETLQALDAPDELFDAFASDEDKAAESEKVETAKAAVSAPAAVSYGGGYSATKLKGTTKTWKHEVTDASQVPAEYLMVDDAKVKAAIKEGVRLIPGIRIYQDESLTLR